MSDLYALAIASSKQEPEIQAHCFGDCGKISLAGAIVHDQLGPLMVCCEETCPHTAPDEDQIQEQIGESGMTGEPVYLRLLEVQEDAA